MGYSKLQDGAEAAKPKSLGESPGCVWKVPLLGILPGCEGTTPVVGMSIMAVYFVFDPWLKLTLHL